jgi:hypothetical protein
MQRAPRKCLAPAPRPEASLGRAGATTALPPASPVPNRVRQAKGSKGHLRQHNTCDTSNAGTSGWFPSGAVG